MAEEKLEKSKKRKKRAKKVPVILQLEALECGAACLTMIMAYYGKWIPLEQVRMDCGVSKDGSNAKNIALAAKKYGLSVRAYMYDAATIREKNEFPCIIYWNANHFVVLDGFKKDKAILNDPANGYVELPFDLFEQSFSGLCMVIEPGEDFVPNGKKKGMGELVVKYLRGTGLVFVFFALLSIAATFFSIVNPAFARFFVDGLLSGENIDLQNHFFVLLCVFAVFQILYSTIQELFSLRAQGKLAVCANFRYMWHVLRLPVSFYSQRMAGDIAERKRTNESIVFTLIHTLAPNILNVFMMIFYFIVMLRYDVTLSIIGVSGLVIRVLAERCISHRRENLSKVMLRDEANLASATVSGIEMIETIKASGAENGFFQKWAGYQAAVNNKEVDIIRINRYYGLIPIVISSITDMLILFFGLYLIIQGEFMVGMLFAFQGLMTGFTNPVQEISRAGSTIREMRANIERIDDVMEYETDVTYEEVTEKEQQRFDKLRGKVEMKHITFGYSKMGPPLIEDFNMTIEPGKKIAFVGSSGCGKSTLAKLLSGLYKPWSGEILFDDVPLDEIRREVFTGSVSVMSQEITLFEDSIADNIKMWDSTIEDYEMIMAANDAKIHEDIIQREGGYQHRLLEGGKNFSGGQRQRMEIARALAQNPSILIMDEATSALDAKTESEVVKAIRNRGMTCIVIAHRLSTVRDCDEIIVLNRGKVVERGTHEELMARQGRYSELITSE